MPVAGHRLAAYHRGLQDVREYTLRPSCAPCRHNHSLREGLKPAKEQKVGHKVCFDASVSCFHPSHDSWASFILMTASYGKDKAFGHRVARYGDEQGGCRNLRRKGIERFGKNRGVTLVSFYDSCNFWSETFAWGSF